MDRNYFLSYSQIAILLLLSAIGKLNASIISPTVNRYELPHCKDIQNTQASPFLSHTLSQELTSCLEYQSYHHINNSDDSPCTAFKNFLQSNIPIANDKDFFLLPMKDLDSISVWKKWRTLSAFGGADLQGIIKQVKCFYINSVKLIDGFKFIVKIPDKLMTAPQK